MPSATGMSIEGWYLVTTVIAVASGIIGYFLKQTMSRVDAHERDIGTIKQTYVTKKEMATLKGELNDDIRKLSEDVADIKENYLGKGDFYRTQAATDKKLDKMYDLLLRMSGGNGNG